MAYRDDREALLARVAALESEVARVALLETRLVELEAENQKLVAENRELRARLADQQAAAPVAQSADALADIYVDDKLSGYASNLISATRSPTDYGYGLAALADQILSGAPLSDLEPLLHAARRRAVAHKRRYVLPDDIRAAASEVLGRSIILHGSASTTVDEVLAALFAAIEVP